MIVVSITNQKGGVGKTTTAVNLAAALSLLDLKCLIIDMDPQGHVGQHLGIQIEQMEDQDFFFDTYSFLEKKVKLVECIYSTNFENLFCVPANNMLAKFNQNNPNKTQFRLREILSKEKLKPSLDLDFVFLDCQPSLSLLTLNALTTSNLVLIPVQAEFLALDGLSQLLLTFKDIKTRLHPKLQILGILLNMFDKRNLLSEKVRQELNKNFGQEIFQSVIPRSVRLAEAPSFGQTIFEYAKNSDIANSYQKLAQEFLQKVAYLDL